MTASPPRAGDEAHVRRAIALARAHMLAGDGGPFGAVVARSDAPPGDALAEGWNQVTSTSDPTAHAEVVAIRRACAALGTFELRGCTLYTSCEPCPMCLSAAYWARVDRVVYGATRRDAAAAGFSDEAIYAELARPVDARALPLVQVLGEEARGPFAEWLAKPDRVAY